MFLFLHFFVAASYCVNECRAAARVMLLDGMTRSRDERTVPTPPLLPLPPLFRTNPQTRGAQRCCAWLSCKRRLLFSFCPAPVWGACVFVITLYFVL